MTPKEIIESGMLELYALGLLAEAERAEVYSALQKHTSLRDELAEIEAALEVYGSVSAVEPPQGAKDKLLREIRNRNTDSGGGNSSVPPHTDLPGKNRNRGSGVWPFVALIVALGLAYSIYQGVEKTSKVEELNSDVLQIQEDCDSISRQLTARLNMLQQVVQPGADITPIQSTEKYPNTQVVFYTNAETERNFIQLIDLPTLNADQSFQLWSLKPDQAPIPLTVWEGDVDQFLEVDYEEGTQTYAITIEPLGGQQSPTLANLIGTASVAGG